MPEPDKKAIIGWSLYDFANTIFSMNVVSRYFPLWVTSGHSAPDIYFSVAISLSMLAVAVCAPVFGAISDQTGHRVRPLIILTLLCALSTAFISLADSVMTGLALFIVANFCYQSALVFYDGLLPTVSRGSSVARVAGLGVGLGYVGAIAGLFMVAPVAGRFGLEAVFIPTGLLFFLFAMPCWLWVKDKPSGKTINAPVKTAINQLKSTFLSAKANRDIFLFLIANVFILDGVNTVIAFMSVYAHRVAGMQGADLTIFMAISTVGAALGSLMWGWLTNRLGAHKTLQAVCALWIFTLVFTAIATSPAQFWMVGPLAGVAMGGVWVAGRTLLVDLAPPERVGEFFGLFNMAGKAASIMGPMVWGVTVALLNPLGGTLQSRVAVMSLAFFIGLGWMLLRKVKEPAVGAVR